MKKTTYLVIISVITIVCVIAGSIKNLGGIKLGWGFPWGFPWGLSDSDNVKVTSIKTDDGNVTADTISLDEFDSVKLDLDIMDVKISEGDEASIHYECSDSRFVPVINCENGVLTAKQKKVKLNFNTKGIKCKMVLTIPRGKKLKDIDVNDSVGDVKSENITGDVFNASLSTGDLKIAAGSFDEINISSSTGDIKLNDCNLGNATISGNTGDIELEDCVFDDAKGNMSISTNTGDVKIKGCNDLGLYKTDFKTDIGDVSVNGKEYKKHYTEDAAPESNKDNISSFTISTNIGDISVTQK